MSAIKNTYFDEINAQSYPDDSDWEYFQHCEDQYERELDAAGTTDEPVEDPEFVKYEDWTEFSYRSLVADLKQIGWTRDRMLVVMDEVILGLEAA